MIALLGSLLGFATSIVPNILKYFEDKRKEEYALSVMDKKMEFQKLKGDQTYDTTQLESTTKEIQAIHKEHASVTRAASQWAINLAASVRPVVTYSLFLEFAVLTVAVFMGWISVWQMDSIWDAEMKAIFAAIVSFWFGQRAFGRRT